MSLLAIGVLGINEALVLSGYKKRGWALFFLYVALITFLHMVGASHLIQLCYIGLIGLCYSLIIPELVSKKNLYKSNHFLSMVRYWLYISCGFSSVLMIRFIDDGLLYISILFTAIWACDICALYGGKAFGKTPFSSLSPNKTLEGTLTGMAAASISIGLICYLLHVSYWMIPLGAIIALLGQFGDLYESLIKRSYNVKDSSNLLPGHGGILDRFDSTLFVFPMAYAVIWFLQ